MAFGARRVFPNDLRPRVAIGVDIPFSGPIGFLLLIIKQGML